MSNAGNTESRASPRIRLMPRSLFGRLVLVLFGGLLVVQVLSTAFLLRDRGNTLFQLFQEDVVLRTENIVRLLDSATPKERERLLSAIGSPTTRITLGGKPESTTPPSTPSVLLREHLRRILPPANHVEVEVAEWPARERPAQVADHPHRAMMRKMPMHRPWAFMHGGMVSADALRIHVQLQDGAWVRLEKAVPKALLEWPSRIIWTLLFMLVTVLLLSLVAVRWTTKPLRMLADAATRLGRDMEHPPLRTDGPSEVAEAAHAFNTMQLRLARFISDRSRILAAVSHDLKTPITRLRLRSELLEDGELGEKIRNDLDDMERMVGETLEFMRGAEVSEKSQPVDIIALIESIQDDAEEAGWSVTVPETNVPPYVGKPSALKRCLTNLIENAVRYGDCATITVSDTPTELKITVGDDGPGVPESELEKLFDPFYRLDTSRSQHTGGSGLGLSIARNIARAHGGNVTLKNRTNGGLNAKLVLPR